MWRERFIKEYAELSDRIIKLEKMLKENDGLSRIGNTPMPLLKAQLGAMKAYKSVLDVRVMYEGHDV